MMAAAHGLAAASEQMLSHTVPTVAPPAGLDEVSISKAVELNTRAAKLIGHLDAGSWNLAGGAMAIVNAALTFEAAETENVSKFTGSGGGMGAPAAAMPNFPPVPSIPDVPIPDVPAPSGVADAEYYSTLVNSGAGEEPHVSAARYWTNTGQSLSQIADVVGTARDALSNGWQSTEAEPALRALNQFHSWVSDVGQSASDLGQDWSNHVAGYRRVKSNIPSPDEAGQTKSDLVRAMDDNMHDGGMSTPRVVYYTGEYNKQNATTEAEMTSYSTGQAPSSLRGAGPGSPPPITSEGPPRVDGTPRPAPGSLQDRLTDDPAMKELKDPKAIMAAMMAAATGAVGGLGAISGAGKGIFQPIQSLPQQVAQQLSSVAQMAAKSPGSTIAPRKPVTASPAKKGGAAGGGKGGGGGVKPAGLGGGSKPTPPPPSATPAATTATPAMKPPVPGAAGRMGAGAMPAGFMPGAAGMAGRGGQAKDKTRNKALFPDAAEIDNDEAHVPGVLGARPEPSEQQKPAYSHKVGTIPPKKSPGPTTAPKTGANNGGNS